jgi:hypothetical protein
MLLPSQNKSSYLRDTTLVIWGELMAKGPRVIYIPSSDEWQHKMPDWARYRREEILNRVRQELGSKRFRYLETGS